MPSRSRRTSLPGASQSSYCLPCRPRGERIQAALSVFQRSRQHRAHLAADADRIADREVIAEAARSAPIVSAGNMSLGVNLLLGITRRIAAALDDEFDIEVLEMHHRHKVDAPSGTALMLADAAARGRGVVLDEVADRGRDGMTGPRRRGAIGMVALRGGDVVGEHQVVFAAPGERIEIGHRASDRNIFARGAITAALWLKDRPPGLYGMEDILGLAET